MPLPDAAERFTQVLCTDEKFGNGFLVDAVLTLVRAETNLDLKRVDLKPDMLAQHLFMNFRLVDEHGRQLAQGRQLSALKAQWGSQARGAFQALAGLKEAMPKAQESADEERVFSNRGDLQFALASGKDFVEGQKAKLGHLSNASSHLGNAPHKQVTDAAGSESDNEAQRAGGESICRCLCLGVGKHPRCSRSTQQESAPAYPRVGALNVRVRSVGSSHGVCFVCASRYFTGYSEISQCGNTL